MTDNEIIKAKVIIKNLHTYCFLTQATYKKMGFEFCENDFNRLNDLIDFINRQRVEIERLNTNMDSMVAEHQRLVKQVKAEAIREFAKFIIDKSKKGVIYDSDIPDYVKEMVGEDNG